MALRYRIAVDVVAEFGPTIEVAGLGPDASLVGRCREQRRAVMLAGGRLKWLGPAGRSSAATAMADGRIYGQIDGRACWFEGERAIELPGLGGEVSGVLAARGGYAVGWADTDHWDRYEVGTENEHRSPRRVGACWVGDQVIPLHSPVGFNSMSNSVNEQGVVVGEATVGADLETRACSWHGGTARLLDLGVESNCSEANAINASGTIVGFVHASDRYLPYVVRGETLAWLGLEGDHGFPNDVDSSGRVVGAVSWSNVRQRWPRAERAWMWGAESGANGVDINSLVDESILAGRTLSNARSIDDGGVILASLGGPARTVVLTRA